MIERVWHGWTTPEDADEYERLLQEEILPGFAEAGIDGYRGARVLRRSVEAGDENADEGAVEFVTILRFDTLDAVREFAGEDYRRAHVPEAARAVLDRFEDEASHYELREEREY